MRLYNLYKQLLKKHGPQGWWPTRKYGYHPSNKTRKLSEQEMLEICIGAILTQNTSWKNVEKALDKLFKARLVNLERLANVRRDRLARLIRSAGYFNQKAERLQLFARHVLKNHGSFSKMFKKKLEPLREELLSLKGIGPETADSMLLYAGRKAVFVVDAYTRRICENHGIVGKDYQGLQEVFHHSLPRKQEVYNEMHALIVKNGKRTKY